MKSRSRFISLLCLLTLVLSYPVFSQGHYGEGDVIDASIFVSGEDEEQISLVSLLGQDEARVNVLYLFGGGDMGAGLNGHLWCQDSFEDTHILRVMVAKYRETGVNFIPVAAAPVYHTSALGQQDRVFLDESDRSRAFKRARKAFIESTLASHAEGILPVKPWFDIRFRLLWNREGVMQAGEGYGDILSWQGAFRAADETQFYGVPGFWVIDNQGKILAEPLRGNIYHPHGGEITIRYTLDDVDAMISSALIETGFQELQQKNRISDKQD